MLMDYVRLHPRVLLLYDSADELDNIAKLLPHEHASAHVLITTRHSSDHSVMQRGTMLSLTYLDGDNGVQALLNAAGRVSTLSDEAVTVKESLDELRFAKKLVQESPIEGLALAIIHAAKFMKKKAMGCRKYYEMLKAEETKLSSNDSDLNQILRYFRLTEIEGVLRSNGILRLSDLINSSKSFLTSLTIKPYQREMLMSVYKKLVDKKLSFIVWEMDLDMVTRENPHASMVLDFASLLSSREIPDSLLCRAVFSDNDDVAQYEMSAAVTSLSEYSLIGVTESNDVNGSQYNVHPLVQQSVWERQLQDLSSLHQRLDAMSQILLDTLSFSRRSISDNIGKPEVSMLIQHLYSVARRILSVEYDSSTADSLVDLACRFSLEAVHVETASLLCSKKLQMAEKQSADGKDPRLVMSYCRGCKRQVLIQVYRFVK